MTLEERVSALEAQNSWLRKCLSIIGTACFCLLACVALAGAQKKDAKETVLDVLRVNKLMVGDPNGAYVAIIDEPLGIVMFDKQGKPRVSLGAPEGLGVITLSPQSAVPLTLNADDKQSSLIVGGVNGANTVINTTEGTTVLTQTIKGDPRVALKTARDAPAQAIVFDGGFEVRYPDGATAIAVEAAQGEPVRNPTIDLFDQQGKIRASMSYVDGIPAVSVGRDDEPALFMRVKDGKPIVRFADGSGKSLRDITPDDAADSVGVKKPAAKKTQKNK